MMAELGRRLFAGVWFAFSALIPVGFYFLFIYENTSVESRSAVYLRVFIGAPILLSGICGAVIGASILDPAKVKTPGIAMLRGLLVSGAAYAIFSIPAAMLFGKDPVSGLIGWPVIFITGLIVIGWLVAIVGVVSGALLYFFRVMSAAHK